MLWITSSWMRPTTARRDCCPRWSNPPSGSLSFAQATPYSTLAIPPSTPASSADKGILQTSPSYFARLNQPEAQARVDRQITALARLSHLPSFPGLCPHRCTHLLGSEGAMLSRIAQSNIARAESPRKHAVLLLAGMLSGCPHKGADARRVPRKHGTQPTLPTPPILIARCVQR